MPVNDLRDHRVEDDKQCWCKPYDDGGVVVHNNMDGREKYETGERKLS